MRLAHLAAVVPLTILTACAVPPLTLTRFDAYGDYDAPRAVAPIVATAKDVKVFYGSSPDGFSLRENELKVEAGFGHKVLGVAKVLDADQACQATDYEARPNSFGASTRSYTKANVIDELRAQARLVGGNAIIYVHTEVTEDGNGEQSCAAVERGEPLGSAWVVVLETPRAAPPGPGSVTPVAPAPTAPTAPTAP